MGNSEKKKTWKKVLKVVLLVILVLVVLFLIHTVRNYIIIKDLQNKVLKYSDSTNYSTKTVATEKDGTIITMEYYKKDNKEAVFLERNLNGEIAKMSIYNNGVRTDTFVVTSDSKVAQLNSGTIMPNFISNYLETDYNWQTVLGSAIAKIKSTNYNGKSCYIVKEFASTTALTYEGAETYIEKDTGLFVKITEGDIVTTKEYKFNNVDSSIFVEPDISQYTLK